MVCRSAGNLNRIRHLFAQLLVRIQSMKIYRRVAHILYSGYSIDVARKKDMDVVGKWFELSEEQKKERQSEEFTCLIARSGERQMGYVELVHRAADHPLYPGYWLCSLWIEPIFRGMGIGEALTQEVINRAQKDDAEGVYLVVWKENKRAISLYRKMGFITIDMPGLDAELERQWSLDGNQRIVMVRRFS